MGKEQRGMRRKTEVEVGKKGSWTAKRGRAEGSLAFDGKSDDAKFTCKQTIAIGCIAGIAGPTQIQSNKLQAQHETGSSGGLPA